MRSNRRSRFRLLLFLATGLGAAAIALTAYFTGLLRTQELATVDTRFSIRGSLPQPKDVVVVQINDDTFSDFGNKGLPNHWPFSRYYHAKVINTLRKDGAKVIAYDIQFTEPTSDGPDNALINAVELNTTSPEVKTTRPPCRSTICFSSAKRGSSLCSYSRPLTYTSG